MERMEDFEGLIRSMLHDEPAEWTSFSAEYEGQPEPGRPAENRPYVRLDLDEAEMMPGLRITFECGEKFSNQGEPWVKPKAFLSGLWDQNERVLLTIDAMLTDSVMQDVKSVFCETVRQFLEDRNLYEVRSEYGG